MVGAEVRRSSRLGADLPVRAASAVVMLLVAGTAFWLGGRVFDVFVGLVALVAFGEMIRLIVRLRIGLAAQLCAMVAGALYVGLAAAALVALPAVLVAFALGIVICTDTGAYFTGRAIGGPRIAPAISPSKTWAGLLGGMTAAGLFGAAGAGFIVRIGSALAPAHGTALPWQALLAGFAIGAVLAVAAQSGDFFESWLKRRAGVKDSSNLIPGHGGVFDRVDGLLPVAIIVGAASSYLLFD
jgi:phosphatidate cytidylyltransferase